jgi:hypothetical protein
MCRFNILIIYSNEKGRKELTSFLYDNGFTVAGSYHAIEEIGSMKVYPDVAVIQPGIHSFLKIVSNLREKFPSIQTLCSNGLLNASLHNGFSYEELKEILKEERLLKRKNLVKCVERMQNSLQNSKSSNEPRELHLQKNMNLSI